MVTGLKLWCQNAPFSIIEWNKLKGQTDPESYPEKQTTLNRQPINENVTELKAQNGTIALKFSLDIVKGGSNKGKGGHKEQSLTKYAQIDYKMELMQHNKY